MWLETPASERFADIRVAEARATGAEIIGTACPHCVSCPGGRRRRGRKSARGRHRRIWWRGRSRSQRPSKRGWRRDEEHLRTVGRARRLGYLEHREGQLEGVSLELLRQGRGLADALETSLTGLLLGYALGDLPRRAVA